MTEAQLNKKINDLVNSLEIITYYKHHYVRKTGLKKAIKKFIKEEDILQVVDNWLTPDRVER